MLEAHPAVSRYCERPTWPDETEAAPEPDFWALRGGAAVWLALGDAPHCEPSVARPPAVLPTVEWIRAEALDEHRVWIQNWLSLLPYLNSTGTPALESLVTSVVQAVGANTCFDELERQLSTTESLLVRTAAITALHRGLLVSEDLKHKQWDRFTRISKLPT